MENGTDAAAATGRRRRGVIVVGAVVTRRRFRQQSNRVLFDEFLLLQGAQLVDYVGPSSQLAYFALDLYDQIELLRCFDAHFFQGGGKLHFYNFRTFNLTRMTEKKMTGKRMTEK